MTSSGKRRCRPFVHIHRKGVNPIHEESIVPQVAVKTHLDGDPKPRPKEIGEWDAIRREHGLDQMLALILLPDESVTDGIFPGYSIHGWAIREDEQGKTTCEPETIDIEIVPDD